MHDADSSSPSDKLVIQSVRRSRGAIPTFLVEVVEGSSFFCPSSFIKEYRIHQGSEFTPEELLFIQMHAERSLAYQKIISLLTRREYTRKELELRLIKKQFSSPAIQAALDEAEERGFISHLRFAEEWIRSRVRKHPESLAVISMGLRQRGVSSREVQESVNQALMDRPDLERELCIAAAKQLAIRISDPQILVKKLITRGFSMSCIRSVSDEVENLTGFRIQSKF